MATTVGQHPITVFTAPVNGTPVDADEVRDNDNSARAAYNAHDADPGIHVQSSVTSARPVAGTAGRKWVTTDDLPQAWYDTGAAWQAIGPQRMVCDVRDYGVVGDGVTDDSAAFATAVAAAYTDGVAIAVPDDLVVICASWTTLTATGPVVIGGGGTIRYTGSSQVAFLTCYENFVLNGVTFDGWFRVVSNPSNGGGAADWVRVTNCKFLNAKTGASNFAYQLLLINPVSNVLIADNLFKNGLYTAFQIGDNVYADQDDASDITIRGNTIDGISMQGATAGVAYGFLVYGRDVTIHGNAVQNVDGPTGAASSASNGASGIYTKARYNTITGNRVTNIGNAVLASDGTMINGIHIKGSDRSGTASPQGYDVVCANNVVRSIGVSNTRGEGIAALHSDALIANNVIEETGLYGIVFADQTSSSSGSVVITGNTLLQAAGASYRGIDVIPSATSRTVVNANILSVANTAIAVRTTAFAGANVAVTSNVIKTTGVAVQLSAASYNLSNCLVANNLIESATHGVFFTTSGGGAHSDHMVTDNDFSAASTSGISGTAGAIPATARIRNNKGYVSENAGVTGAIATGATVSHGCAATPTVVLVSSLGATPTNVYVTSIGASTFTINYGGGGTNAFAWQALTANHYA